MGGLILLVYLEVVLCSTKGLVTAMCAGAEEISFQVCSSCKL